MKRILVWDLPTRLFHWLLVVGFVAAFTIASVVSHRDPTFPWHMLVGLTLGLMVALRVLWGFVGTRHARFRSFVYGPQAVLGYLRGVMTRSDQRYVGHNPGSSAAIYAMLLLVVGLVATGLLAVSGIHVAGDIHQILAWTLLVTAVVHVLGIVVHTWRHRENIAMSMVSGHKEAAEDQAIPGAKPVVAVVFLALTGAWGWGLAKGYDPGAKTLQLPVFGTTLKVGKAKAPRPGSRPGG